jgi:hypothetical protein
LNQINEERKQEGTEEIVKEGGKKKDNFGINEVKEFNKNERIMEVSSSQTLSSEELDKRAAVIQRERQKQS